VKKGARLRYEVTLEDDFLGMGSRPGRVTWTRTASAVMHAAARS
jgi:hypothetical protein